MDGHSESTDQLLHLRLLTGADLAFADSVRALAGWNQTLDDWQRFLATEPGGCFLAEWNGVPAGTATTTVYGPALAWIGMVLVHPAYRRRGIGHALLHCCIEYLLSRGVACIKLDATPLGKTVYAGFGFEDEWTLTRWARPAGAVPPPISHRQVRPWRDADAPRVEALDSAAFGTSRQRLLVALVRQSRWALVREAEPDGLKGFGLLRPGSQALLWDIPDQNTVAVSLAEQHRFTVQRPLTRMFLGENLAPGDPLQQFALTGPETG
jgi:GNAT superfamily N-acetyltransferase